MKQHQHRTLRDDDITKTRWSRPGASGAFYAATGLVDRPGGVVRMGIIGHASPPPRASSTSDRE